MNFGPKSSLLFRVLEPRLNVVDFAQAVPDFAVEPRITERAEHARDLRPPGHAKGDHRIAAELGATRARSCDAPLEPCALGGARGHVQPGDGGRARATHEARGLAPARARPPSARAGSASARMCSSSATMRAGARFGYGASSRASARQRALQGSSVKPRRAA